MLENLISHFKQSGRVVFETLGSYADRWRAENEYGKWCLPPSVHAPTS